MAVSSGGRYFSAQFASVRRFLPSSRGGSTMKNPQSRASIWVVSFGAALFVASLSFPPWSFTYQSQGISQVRKPAGYAFLLSPPPPQEEKSRLHGIVLDWSQLGAQLLAITVTTGAVWYVCEVNAKRRGE
jgi:hypothetical protein